MPLISQAELERAYALANSPLFPSRSTSTMAKHARMGVTAVETLGAAALAGVAMGRYGSMEVFGVPAAALAGLALHAAGFMFEMEDAHALGNGLLASYALTLGAGVGDKMAAAQGGKWPAPTPTSFTSSTKASVSGLPSAQRGVTEAELAHMVSAVR